MSVLPFPDRAHPFEQFRLAVELTKDAHRWRYEIRPLVGSTECQTWVRYDGQAHRAQLTTSLYTVQQLHAQYLREIARLEADGWARG
jgi:hypothetical protein